MIFQRRWISEDAFIDLRVVRNLLAGHGPVYNIGERVEAFTNPLWVALLTGYGALGLPLEAGPYNVKRTVNGKDYTTKRVIANDPGMN